MGNNMNKELGRKITSLTLMTIMLTWSAAMGFTGSFMPEAEAANQYLWVSAESAKHSNMFYGAQVLEIVVTDPAINRLDESYGMPDVSIDGAKVIMAQGVDGSWYAYVADGTFAVKVDALYPEEEDGRGADFGRFCKNNTPLEFGANGKSVANLLASDSRGVAIPFPLGNSSLDTTDETDGVHNSGGAFTNIGAAQFNSGTYTQGTGITTECGSSIAGIIQGGGIVSYLNATSDAHVAGNANADNHGVNGSADQINNVVREARALSNGTTTDFYGNIALGPNLWPLIQLYDFTGEQKVDIVYAKGGADESVQLIFDLTNGSSEVTLDRDTYGLLHEVGLQIEDAQWNIDPTDEDSWTFNTLPGNTSAWYQLFDENGIADSEDTVGAIEQSGPEMQSNWGMDEGVLIIDRNGPGDAAQNIIDFQDNGDQIVLCNDGACGTHASISSDKGAAMTLTETGANTGIFRNWDEAITTNMIIASDAARGTQASLNWNDEEYSILVMPSWGSVSYNTEYNGGIGAEWNAGELVEIVIEDNDMNFDSRLGDTMYISSNQSIVPALKIGSPITGASLDSVSHIGGAKGITVLASGLNDNACSSKYSSGGAAAYNQCYEKYSERTVMNNNAGAITFTDGDVLKFVYDKTLGDFKTFVTDGNGTAGYEYFQYDLRDFNGGNNMDYWVNFTVMDGAAISSTSYEKEIVSQINTVNDDGGSDMQFTASCQGLVGTCLFTGYTTQGTVQNKVSILTDNIDNLTEEFNIYANITSRADTTHGGTLFTLAAGTNYSFYLDVVKYGQSNDGINSGDRHNDSIIRMEVDETDQNSGVFIAELEYILLNQLNVNNSGTYNATKSFDDEVIFIVHNDLTDEDEVRINYFDMGADGVETQVADQLAAPTHSGVVEFDNDSYKEADTVVVTLTDSDLNTNPDLINIYTVVSTSGDEAYDQVGEPYYGSNSVGDNFGRMLDITFDDETWLNSDQGTACSSGGSDGAGTPVGDDGLSASGFSLVETGKNTGIFTGDFQVPAEYCSRNNSNAASSSMGTDIEVNYVDYRDASGEIIEVGDGAGIRGNTGSVSLDRTVYPVPFGTIGDFSAESSSGSPNGRSLFPVHSSSVTTLDSSTETIGSGDLTIHIRVDDPDYDLSAAGEDNIAENTTSSSNRGPLKIYVARGSAQVVLATAGADTASSGYLTSAVVTCGGQTEITSTDGTDCTRELGPIAETAPDSGVFELDMTVRYTDGPQSSDCTSKTSSYTATDGGTTSTETDRFDTAADSGKEYCIMQGDVITVEYSDQNDASGNSGVAYDSATFDLRNGVLQTDKSVYIIGSDIIMTLIEPDLDLESDESETWDLDLIDWDSDAKQLTMGNPWWFSIFIRPRTI